MAPEWVFNLHITSKVDVYSYGIVLLELVTGRSPAMGIHEKKGSTEQRTLVPRVREHMAKAKETETWKIKIIDPKLKGIYDPFFIGKYSTLLSPSISKTRLDIKSTKRIRPKHTDYNNSHCRDFL
ncbi:hypothetical protein REPUB_Repub17cG0077400 [Reevesia pubescens]